MKTFTEIEMLLERLEQARKTSEMVLDNPRTYSCDAGIRFLQNRLNHEDSLRMQLIDNYPWHWVQTVKYVISLRNKN